MPSGPVLESASAPAQRPALAEPRQTRAALLAGQPSGAALARLLSVCAADFEKHRVRLMLSDDPEGPHGARVALRRLRTALLAFAPLLRRRPAHALDREARRLFRRLGRLRDADVLAGTAAGTPQAASCAAAAARQRVALRAELDALDAAGFATRVTDFTAGTGWRRRSAKRAARGPVEVVAAAALDAAWARQRAHGKRLQRLSVEDRHEFRKQLKVLRYESDFFGPLWPGPRQVRFLQLLKALQDDLGHLNDLALAEAQLGPQDADAANVALAQAAADWRGLRRTRPWWRRK